LKAPINTHKRHSTPYNRVEHLKGSHGGEHPTAGAGTYSLAADKGLTAGSLGTVGLRIVGWIKDVLSQELDLKAGRKQCTDFRATWRGLKKPWPAY
jgi:hypothetical protein